MGTENHPFELYEKSPARKCALVEISELDDSPLDDRHPAVYALGVPAAREATKIETHRTNSTRSINPRVSGFNNLPVELNREHPEQTD